MDVQSNGRPWPSHRQPSLAGLKAMAGNRCQRAVHALSDEARTKALNRVTNLDCDRTRSEAWHGGVLVFEAKLDFRHTNVEPKEA